MWSEFLLILRQSRGITGNEEVMWSAQSMSRYSLSYQAYMYNQGCIQRRVGWVPHWACTTHYNMYNTLGMSSSPSLKCTGLDQSRKTRMTQHGITLCKYTGIKQFHVVYIMLYVCHFPSVNYSYIVGANSNDAALFCQLSQ